MCGQLLRREWIVSALLALAAISCKSSEENAHYRTRGLVTGVSGEGEDLRAAIHHEEIAAFKDRDGKPSVMESMTMNFALGPGVDRALVKKDAKLDFEFDVIWSSGSPLVITKLQVLPADASLALRQAR